MKTSAWVVLGFAILTCGCGKEAGRVPFAAEGKADSTMTLSSGDVSFWTDLDIDHQGDAGLHYNVELLQGGAVVATTTCNPLGSMSVKTSWVETNLGDHHTRSGNGKMACSVKLPAGGATVVRAQLAFSKKPPTLTLKKADLAVRQ